MIESDITNISANNIYPHNVDSLAFNQNFANDSFNFNVSHRSDLPGKPFDYYTYYRDDSGRVTMMLSQPTSVIGIFLGILGILLNLLCMIALFQVRAKWTCLFRIMLSLMLSDMLTATSYMAHVFRRAYTRHYFPGLGPWDIRLKTWCTFTVIKAFCTMGMNVTLLNLMVMAIDHFIAILYPMRYQTLLSIKKSNFMIIIIWLIAALTGFSDFFSPLWDLKSYRIFTRYNLCEFIWLSVYQEEYTTFAIAFVCTCVMLILYLSIYCAARDKVRNVAVTEKDGSIGFKHNKNKRALVTTFLILGTFILCWLPMCCFQVILLLLVKFRSEYVVEMTDKLILVDNSLVCVVLLNTVCDPIIYAIRIREVRLGFLVFLGKIAPKSLKHKFTDPQSSLNYRRYSLSYRLSERRGTLCSGLESGNTEEDSGVSLSQQKPDGIGDIDSGYSDNCNGQVLLKEGTDSEKGAKVLLFNESEGLRTENCSLTVE